MQGGINNAALFGASQREARSKLDQMAGIKRPSGILASSPELMQAAMPVPMPAAPAAPMPMAPPPAPMAPMAQPSMPNMPMNTTVAPMAPRPLNPMAAPAAPAAAPAQPVVKLNEGGFLSKTKDAINAIPGKMAEAGMFRNLPEAPKVDITDPILVFLEKLDKNTGGAVVETFGSLEEAAKVGQGKAAIIGKAASSTDDPATIANAALVAADEEPTDAAKQDFAENVFGMEDVNDIDEINRRIANVAIGSSVGKGPDKFAEAVLFGLQTVKQTASARAAGAAGAGGEKSRQEYLYKSVFDATYKAALENDPENPGEALAAARTAAQTAAPNAPSAAMGGQPAAAPSQTPLQQVQEALQLEPQRREEILKQATDMGIDVKGL